MMMHTEAALAFTVWNQNQPIDLRSAPPTPVVEAVEILLETVATAPATGEPMPMHHGFLEA